ncbi:MAG: hypothetical protein H6597_03695 [Flavobacteriales bacterium]|nr:hypothetical protein [Flavobacteriales bacterium]MCB9193612.1 hypothetical protein [Flavobacteriales bacterium]
MLQGQVGRWSAIATTMALGHLQAQVQLEGPLILTAPDSTERTVLYVAPPATDSSLITLGVSRSDAVHWATVGGSINAITLSLTPPASRYTEGMVVRFIPQQTTGGSVTLNVDGLGARQLLGRERLDIPLSDLIAGQLAEARFTDSVFVLMPHPSNGCPEGFLAANDHLCFQQDDGAVMYFYDASSYCTRRGARLCTWDEYIHACVALGPLLSGLFDDWEWMDDTSDHTHTVDEVGRWECQSQRSVSGEVHPNYQAQVRCCYRLH